MRDVPAAVEKNARRRRLLEDLKAADVAAALRAVPLDRTLRAEYCRIAQEYGAIGRVFVHLQLIDRRRELANDYAVLDDDVSSEDRFADEVGEWEEYMPYAGPGRDGRKAYYARLFAKMRAAGVDTNDPAAVRRAFRQARKANRNAVRGLSVQA